MARNSAKPNPDATGPGGSAGPPLESAVHATPDQLAPAPPEPTATADPVPLEVPLEEQITQLPPLAYPGSTNEEFDRWVGEKRRGRLRLEILGGALLLIGGVIATVVSGRPAFILLAIFGLAGLGAYEFLVTSFE